MFLRKSAIYILTCVSLLLILSSCMEAKNTLISEKMSPDGKYEAIVFTRDAGATTTKSYNLSIVKNGENFNGPVGNTFHSDSDFSVEWIENQKLHVKISDSSKRIITQLEKVDDVVIEYESNLSY